MSHFMMPLNPDADPCSGLLWSNLGHLSLSGPALNANILVTLTLLMNENTRVIFSDCN